jgi:hypothetical protein
MRVHQKSQDDGAARHDFEQVIDMDLMSPDPAHRVTSLALLVVMIPRWSRIGHHSFTTIELVHALDNGTGAWRQAISGRSKFPDDREVVLFRAGQCADSFQGHRTRAHVV